MRIALYLAATFLAVPAWAEDRALVIGNENYTDAADVTEADAAALSASALRTGGFRVIGGADLATADIRRLLSQALLEGVEDGRLVILLSGHFAQSLGETWFLGTESSVPDLATAGSMGVTLQTILGVAATQSGGAVVLLGTEARRLPLGPGLVPGIGALDIPQGVTVISGDAGRVADFAARSLSARGQSLVALLGEAPDLKAEGFLSSLVPFRPADPKAPPVTPEGPDAEAIFWQSTLEQSTPEAYDAYLKRYPTGRFADIATTEAARIRSEPGRQARLTEQALALSRDDRASIQRALSLLEFDPKGIDGVFGAGSRAAIGAWQKQSGFEPTTYLTREQTVSLLSQADRKAEQLEAEAALRKAELERQDQLYWNQTGAAGDEAGLRAYLKRYPDGMFAEIATDRLAAIDAKRKTQAAAQDRLAWDLAEKGDSIASYQDYLAAFPKGAFAAEAKARIGLMQAETSNQAELAKLHAAEVALGLGPQERRLIESRLDTMGLRPGVVDGAFDEQTRRAIRRYQAERKLKVTGFLDQLTLVNLLADGVLKLE